MKNMNNIEKNSHVKKQITNTLLDLIKKESLNQISVRDLCNEAGVGRASFYRNYESKEDVLTAYIIKQWRDYEKKHLLKEHRLDDMFRVQSYFEFCFSMRSLNDNLILQKQEGVILKAYEIIMPNSDQNQPNESYAMSYMAYGLFGIFMKWAKDNYKQSPKEMAEIVITEIFKDYQIEGL